MARTFTLPLVPASFFGMVLGLVGLGNAWRAATQVWGAPMLVGELIMLAGTVVWAVVLVLYVAKWIVARTAALAEAEHPVQCCFIGLAGIATTLTAMAVLPYTRGVAVLLFTAGSLFTVGFAVWRTGEARLQGRVTAGANQPGQRLSLPERRHGAPVLSSEPESGAFRITRLKGLGSRRLW